MRLMKAPKQNTRKPVRLENQTPFIILRDKLRCVPPALKSGIEFLDGLNDLVLTALAETVVKG